MRSLWSVIILCALSELRASTVVPALDNVSVLEGEPLTLSCSAQQSIKYCYFRARNGTVYSATDSALQYVGAGLNAGECGIMFSAMSPVDSGAWRCTVALDAAVDELSATFNVQVTQKLSVTKRVTTGLLEIEVHAHDSLDYCRFVRVDGVGFTTSNPPAGYLTTGSLYNGECNLHIENPSILDLHHWGVAVRLTGRTEEITAEVSTSFSDYWSLTTDYVTVNWIWIVLGVFALILVILAGIYTFSRRHRQWVSTRVLSVRESFIKRKIADDMCDVTTTEIKKPPQYQP